MNRKGWAVPGCCSSSFCSSCPPGESAYGRAPLGPEVLGVRILNYLFIALIFTVLIAAIHSAAGEKANDDTPGIKLFNIFLWVFLGLMGIAIIAGLLL